MFSADPLQIVASISALGALWLWYRGSRSGRYPLPPGPKKLPILGNLFDLPSSYEWEDYAKWAKEYSELGDSFVHSQRLLTYLRRDTDILHLDVCGQSIIVLDTYEACMALLEKRSRYYSSRCAYSLNGTYVC